MLWMDTVDSKNVEKQINRLSLLSDVFRILIIGFVYYWNPTYRIELYKNELKHLQYLLDGLPA